MSRDLSETLWQEENAPDDAPPSLKDCLIRLGIHPRKPETLPFVLSDATAGSETELQVAVSGSYDTVDLPVTLRASSYVSGLIKKVMSGDIPSRALFDLNRYFRENQEQVWEHSWVRISRKRLHAFTWKVFDADLRCSSDDPDQGYRKDIRKFFCLVNDEEFIRVPVSYLIKLALADALVSSGLADDVVYQTGLSVMRHFLNDNTSPETSSFHVTSMTPDSGYGRALAGETAQRFLLTNLLILYADARFGLTESGQRVSVYFSPHPPVRLRQLNDCIPDAVYRELFMSPCLSGWPCGEAKHDYMILCHQTLSRSHLNAVSKLREAGILTHNLVVLPRTSNISLANNGAHVSLGSRHLEKRLRSGAGFSSIHEKHLGDLAIKIQEHFLPLFVGTFSAAPYRLDFVDFHPEQALGFLPHELDYTHLRMIWRRWKKKADNRVAGYPMTPFGPPLLDKALRTLLRLNGDLIPDFRLIDYPAALLSTPHAPALNGVMGNQERLKKELDDSGIFDRRMSVYLPIKLRDYERMGFSGFELRCHSLFESLETDMTHAVNLQLLITALAFKYIVSETFGHPDIPDNPVVESERRQIFFGTAIGIPTFYVRKDTANRLMLHLIQRTARVRSSRRYPGYLRVYNREFQNALVDTIQSDAADLIEIMGLEETIEDIRRRIERPEDNTVFHRLTAAIKGKRDRPEQSFNMEAERYYRGPLRRKHLGEGLAFLLEDCRTLDRQNEDIGFELRGACKRLLSDETATAYLERITSDLLRETLPEDQIARLIHLMLLIVHIKSRSPSFFSSMEPTL